MMGPGKPLLFLIKTFRVAGVNTRSSAHMAIQQGSGMLSLLILRDAGFVLAMSCDFSLKRMESLTKRKCLTSASAVKSGCLELLMVALQVERKCLVVLELGLRQLWFLVVMWQSSHHYQCCRNNSCSHSVELKRYCPKSDAHQHLKVKTTVVR